MTVFTTASACRNMPQGRQVVRQGSGWLGPLRRLVMSAGQSGRVGAAGNGAEGASIRPEGVGPDCGACPCASSAVATRNDKTRTHNEGVPRRLWHREEGLFTRMLPEGSRSRWSVAVTSCFAITGAPSRQRAHSPRISIVPVRGVNLAAVARWPIRRPSSGSSISPTDRQLSQMMKSADVSSAASASNVGSDLRAT